MGRGVIDKPVEHIAQYLEAHERRKEWDKYLVVRALYRLFQSTSVIWDRYNYYRDALVSGV